MIKKISSKMGYSLIELLVVATIIIVLMTIGMVSYRQSSRSGRNAKRKSDLEAVRQALVLYRNDNTEYPDPVAADDTNAAFEEMLVTIVDYISFSSLTDPKSPTYDYTYGSNGLVFDLCATLETSSGTDSYCIDNP
jgi:type II secretory pathway pseudopilin PulG